MPACPQASVRPFSQAPTPLLPELSAAELIKRTSPILPEHNLLASCVSSIGIYALSLMETPASTCKWMEFRRTFLDESTHRARR